MDGAVDRGPRQGAERGGDPRRAGLRRAALAEGGWKDLRARTWTEASFFLAFFQMAEGLYFIIGLVFFVLASTVLVNTTMMVVFERTREIGTVGALGMKGREIVRMFLLEALALAVIGAAAGIVLGLLIALPLQLLRHRHELCHAGHELRGVGCDLRPARAC